MRVLFYLGDSTPAATARVALAAAKGLAARGHQITVGARTGGATEHAALAFGLETTPIDADASAVGGAFDLRRVLAERFVEVAVVSSERDHLIVASAMRFAERGGVLRRVAPCEKLTVQRAGKLALKLAAAGVIVSTERELAELSAPGWAAPPTVVPLGVDVAAYDAVEPAARAEIGAPPQGPIVACAYDPSGRHRLGAVLRALALFAPRHRDVHLVVFGPGATDDELRLHAAALGVNSIVTFDGESLDAFGIMRAATAGWVVASGDAGAMACLDFMALRVPVIADRSPLTQTYVADGISGMLLPPEDASATASAVASFLSSDERRAAMGNAGRTRVQREFSEGAMIDGFERAVSVAGDRTRWAAP